MADLTITISGVVGSGKSTIARVIRKALMDKNLEVVFEPAHNDEFGPEFDKLNDPVQQAERLRAIRLKNFSGKCIIEIKQSPRRAYLESSRFKSEF